METYLIKGDKKLRYGFTTGTCAAAAAKAATTMLLTGKLIDNIDLVVPKGWELSFPVLDAVIEDDKATCAIKKDSGDDPDVTNGMLIFASVKKASHGEIILDGGEGVGRITRKGLSVPVGQAAINPVPRKMIINEVSKIAEAHKYGHGLFVEISVPGGESVAKKTFNPKLGIEGGISIIGTTGIVEPMSEKALIDSIVLEMNVLKANGVENILITPGNYGKTFAGEKLGLDTSRCVKISNYVGDMMSSVNQLEFQRMLFIAHAGKLIKVAGGIMNTHSKHGDARMEILSAHVSCMGGTTELVQKIMDCITTDEAIDLIIKHDFFNDVIDSILRKTKIHISNKIPNIKEFGIIMFTNTHGVLGMSDGTQELLNYYRK